MKLTVEEYAKRKGISKTAVYNKINGGRLQGFLSKENGLWMIDEKALLGEFMRATQEKMQEPPAASEQATIPNAMLLETIAEQKAEIAELKAELKAERAQAQAQSAKIIELMEKQLTIQENFQVLLAKKELPSPAPAPVEVVETVETAVENIENKVEAVETEVENPAPKKRRKWRLFGKKDNSSED